MASIELQKTDLTLTEIGINAGLMPDEAVYDAISSAGEGVVGRARIIPFGAMAEIGYQVDETKRLRGFGTAICRQVSDLALANYPEVFAQVDTDNPASMRVLEKSGFFATDHLETSVIYKRFRS